jgi:hypothetical protein
MHARENDARKAKFTFGKSTLPTGPMPQRRMHQCVTAEWNHGVVRWAI